MKKFLLILLISFSSQAFEYKDYVHKVRVYYGIVEEGPNKGRQHWGFGTATSVDIKDLGYEGNTLLTAGHVVAGKYLELDVLVNEVYYHARVLKIDEAKDIALISIEIRLKSLKLNEIEVNIDDKVYGAGYPHGEDLAIDRGKLKRKGFKESFFSKENLDFWTSSVKVINGFSGGPILDRDYKVLGIIVMYVQDEYNAIFVPVRVIREFLSKG